MAKENITDYNTCILKLRIPKLLIVLAVTASTIAVPLSASAQNLQNASNGIQSETGQTQNSANTQNQVGGGVQENSSQGLLNQKVDQPLGVVSNPKQNNPDSVVTPSNSLRADRTAKQSSSKIPYIAGLFVGFIVVALGVSRLLSPSETTPVNKTAPVVKPEPIKAPKKKKQTRKKRKQTTQR